MQYFIVNNLLLYFTISVMLYRTATTEEPNTEELNNLREQYTALKADNDFLRQESIDLTKRAEELQGRLDVLERLNEETARINRRNNIVIYGVICQGSLVEEKPIEIVKKIGEFLNFPISERDIVDCYRLQQGERGRPTDPLLVKFTNVDIKELFMKKMKSRELNGSIIGGDSRTRIFVSEHLTKLAAMLFKEALTLKNRGYPYVWSKSGFVYVKKLGEEESAIRIETLDQIRSLAEAAKQDNN